MTPTLTDADREALATIYLKHEVDWLDQTIAYCLAAGRAAERERCAKWCEKNEGTACAQYCAAAIRALDAPKAEMDARVLATRAPYFKETE